ncbi:MAG: 50S ribosomal protein L24 [Gammaproteobacteria bacterium]|nr:50S ribosomal protein L24 [Gammaproteobacteria bacterium]MDD9824964.1 50S ribosomal protein L24 [Gammaproteobacteria bacterium]MDD9863621.1 50S ribosomal protein L24 [Gammaproteobacteria bacterium]
MQKIRKGDRVVVMTGKYKGRQGVVLKMLPREDKVIVEGVNMVKRHVKPRPQLRRPGGIIEREAPIHISNLAVFNPVTQKPDRIGFRFLEDGKKVRYFKSNNEVVDV